MQKQFLEIDLGLKKMVGKKVHVTLDGGWTGYVIGVIDESTLNVSRGSGKLESVNIFDIRSV